MTYGVLEVSNQKYTSLTTLMQCHKTMEVTQNYVYMLVYLVNDERNATKRGLLSCREAVIVNNMKPVMWTLLEVW